MSKVEIELKASCFPSNSMIMSLPINRGFYDDVGWKLSVAAMRYDRQCAQLAKKELVGTGRLVEDCFRK